MDNGDTPDEPGAESSGQDPNLLLRAWLEGWQTGYRNGFKDGITEGRSTERQHTHDLLQRGKSILSKRT